MGTESVPETSENLHILTRLYARENFIDIYLLLTFLKPTGYVMHQQFNINNCTLGPHCIDVFCIYIRTNSDLCHLQHKLFGFYNRDEKCLQRGTDWVFK